MAKIEIRHTIIEAIEVPECFCGAAPEIYTQRSQSDNRYSQLAWLECPYCRAQSHKHQFYIDSVNSKYEAVTKAIDEWRNIMEKKEEESNDKSYR